MSAPRTPPGCATCRRWSRCARSCGRAGRDDDSGAGQDRARPVRRRTSTTIADLAVESGPGRHRRHQHHGVSGRACVTPGVDELGSGGCPGRRWRAVPGGPAPAVRAGRRPPGADQRRRHRDRRRRLGADRFRGITAAGLHRFRLRRRAYGSSTFTTASRNACTPAASRRWRMRWAAPPSGDRGLLTRVVRVREPTPQTRAGVPWVPYLRSLSTLLSVNTDNLTR